MDSSESPVHGEQEGSETQQVYHVSNGRGRFKQGDIYRDIVSDQSNTMLFTTMSYFSMQTEGQVSLIVRFLEKNNKYQRKW